MSEVPFTFLVVAAIILIGYFGVLFFKKTKISEIIILLLVGLLIGPISGALGFGFLDEIALTNFENFLPFFASFALIMILFEGGLHLNFFKTIKALPGSLSFSLGVFFTTMILAVLLFWLFGFAGLIEFNLLLALFIASIIGGTSSAVIVPVIRNTSAKEETKTLLMLESALTDIFCVITAVAIAQIFLIGTVDISTISSGIFSNFSIGVLMGFIFGLIWLKLLSIFEKNSYAYLVTLSALLIVYSIVEFVGGNGAIAVLLFGIVLGNSEDITGMLRITRRSINNNIRSFQSELSFLIKTFFFVYLGLLFKLEYITGEVLLMSVALLILIIFARKTISTIISKFKKVFETDIDLLTWMSARGLAAAVLVSLPISMGLDKLPDTLFTPEILSQITAIAFFIILLTNVATTYGIFKYENKHKNDETPKEKLIKDLKETTLRIKKDIK